MTWVEGLFCITLFLQTNSIFASKLIPIQLPKPVNARKSGSHRVKTRGLYVKTGTRHGHVPTQQVQASVLSFPPKPIAVKLLKQSSPFLHFAFYLHSNSWSALLLERKTKVRSKGGREYQVFWHSKIFDMTKITRMQMIFLVLNYPKNMHIELLCISKVAAGKMTGFHFKSRQAIRTLLQNDCVNQR